MRMILPLFTLALATLPACAKPATQHAEHATATSASPRANGVGGCRDVYLYAANEDRTQVVVIDVDAKAVGLTKGEKKSFDLASAPKGVRVWLDVYLQPAHVENVHCTKTPTEPQMAERYAANAGTLNVELAADGAVTATITGAKFMLDGRPTIELATRRIERVRV